MVFLGHNKLNSMLRFKLEYSIWLLISVTVKKIKTLCIKLKTSHKMVVTQPVSNRVATVLLKTIHKPDVNIISDEMCLKNLDEKHMLLSLKELKIPGLFNSSFHPVSNGNSLLANQNIFKNIFNLYITHMYKTTRWLIHDHSQYWSCWFPGS